MTMKIMLLVAVAGMVLIMVVPAFGRPAQGPATSQATSVFVPHDSCLPCPNDRRHSTLAAVVVMNARLRINRAP